MQITNPLTGLACSHGWSLGPTPFPNLPRHAVPRLPFGRRCDVCPSCNNRKLCRVFTEERECVEMMVITSICLSPLFSLLFNQVYITFRRERFSNPVRYVVGSWRLFLVKFRPLVQPLIPNQDLHTDCSGQPRQPHPCVVKL